jgi:fermentation-respiration switch protein FrsA (DUF1100 family)
VRSCRTLPLALALTAPACARKVASRNEIDAYRRAAGLVAKAEIGAAQPRGRYVLTTVRLTSTTGLVATGQMLVPGKENGPGPAVLLQDGREENSNVVGRLPAEFGDVVVMALDYPADIPYEIQLGDVALKGRKLGRAAHLIPALFVLGAEYLASRRDVDTSRVAIAATSFAVPFATIAAAAETRFSNVALIYGAGDLPAVLAANLDITPAALRGPVAWLATRPFADLGPERFAGAIAPRPIVMVNGVDDPQMPRSAVEKLYDAARQPKTLIWLHTGHLEPTDSALIRALVDTALDRMPVLH